MEHLAMDEFQVIQYIHSKDFRDNMISKEIIRIDIRRGTYIKAPCIRISGKNKFVLPQLDLY